MKSKKRYLVIFFVLSIILISYFFINKNKTVFYLGISNPSDNIDLLVKVDEKQLYKGILEYNPYNYVIIDGQLKGGFHTIYVKSKKANLSEKFNIFILFNQYIVIEYFPESEDKIENASLRIDKRLTPFYYE